MIDPSKVRKVYVSSARRGFMAVADWPMCIDSLHGSSGSHIVIGIKRVARREGAWHWEDVDSAPQLWLRKAWDGAVGLQGDEPWRVYELDAAEVAARLDAGEHVDDVRGFESRLEPWQPIRTDALGSVVSTVPSAEAEQWERTDGWRVVFIDGVWRPDGTRCNADPGILEYSPDHFIEFSSAEGFPAAVKAMEAVDMGRPWS